MSLKLEEGLHLAQPPTTMSQEEEDYGSWADTVNLVLEQQAEGVQHKAVHLALSTLGLPFPNLEQALWRGLVLPQLSPLQIFCKAKVKLKTTAEHI